MEMRPESFGEGVFLSQGSVDRERGTFQKSGGARMLGTVRTSSFLSLDYAPGVVKMHPYLVIWILLHRLQASALERPFSLRGQR